MIPVNFCESSGRYHELRSPNDQRVLGNIQYATSKDCDHLIGLLPGAQRKIAALPAFERANILKKVSARIREDAKSWAHLISSEGGKPLKDAEAEVSRASITLELCAEESLRIGGETLPMERTPAALNHMSFTFREPIGPVLAISAFNHPLNLLAHQVGCAVASGCTTVIKPAPATPLCAHKLLGLFNEAGMEEGLFIVNADVPEIEKLVSSPVFAYVSFIGSAQVGWGLRKNLAPGTRLALEHGGQAPAIVRADADLHMAVPALIKGAFYHAGQVCISTQRLFVHRSKFASFLSDFKKAAMNLRIGDATLPTTDIGPLIRPAEVKRIRSWIDEALQEGAKLELGNKVSGPQDQFLSPTILIDVPRESKLMQEEVFGPVVCLNSYEDEEELLHYLNQGQYVFEASVFTKDISAAMNWAKKLSTMTVVINDHNAYRVDWMPFGGHKLSGLGMGGVKYAIEEMTRLKQVIIKYQ